MTWFWKGVAFLALVAAAGLGLWGWQAQCRADRFAVQAQAAEASALKSAGGIVAEKVRADAAERLVGALRDTLSQVREKTPSAKVVSGATWTGEPCTFDLPGVFPPLPGDSGPRLTPPTITLQAGPHLSQTMTIEPRGVEAVVEGKAGAQALIGHVDLWQVDPPPERLLGRSRFRADVSRYFVVEKPEAVQKPLTPRWAVGPLMGVSSRGMIFGAVVEAPSVHFWRFEARPKLIGLVGAGDTIVAGGVAVGW